MADGPASAAGDTALRYRSLLALIGGQIGLHSAMSGLRMALPLQALTEGRGAWLVGLLIALFAAAGALVALPAGRAADRSGYHRPLGAAVICCATGASLALLAMHAAGVLQLVLLCAAAVGGGAGAHIGLITVQRTAGRSAASATERMRVFSWLGLAPTISNVVGPVGAGVLIDAAGFGAAFCYCLTLPLVSWALARRVPREAPVAKPAGRRGRAWDLWRIPGFARVVAVNGLMSSCWDVHGFAVPVLGHARNFSASTIGLVLALLPVGASVVRLLIPLIATRLDEVRVLRGAMLWTALVFAVYPLLMSPLAMGLCSCLIGLALGAVQPMVMSTLHHLTPHDRHGEAIALRSMTMNVSSSLMPLAFGLTGATLGVATLFWLIGGAVALGSGLPTATRTKASPPA